VSERTFFLWFIERLPTYDPAWPADIQAAWMECFTRLWQWGCRLTVEDAIDMYVEAGNDGL